jgi:hypothetical protein
LSSLFVFCCELINAEMMCLYSVDLTTKRTFCHEQ